VENVMAIGDWRKYLICQMTLNDLNLDFVPPDLDFVLSGLDFVPKNLDFLPMDLDFLPRAGASALSQSSAQGRLNEEGFAAATPQMSSPIALACVAPCSEATTGRGGVARLWRDRTGREF
jgi:hypothetical protein